MINNKLKTLFKVLKLVYKTRPFHAISRDTLLILSVGLEMYLITLGGLFIDATEKFFREYKYFTLESFFSSESFFFLAIGVAVWIGINAIAYWRNQLALVVQRSTYFEMETMYYAKLSNENMEDVESSEFRDLVSFVDNYGTTNVLDTYSYFSEILKEFVRVVAAYIFLFSLLGPIVFTLTVFALPETIVGYFNRRKLKQYQDKEVERIKWLDYVWNLMTRIQYFPEMRVDGTFKKLRRDYADKSRDFMNRILYLNKHMNIDSAFFSTIGRVFMAVGIIYAISLSLLKGLSIGSFKAIYDYILTAYENSIGALDKMFRISNSLEYASKFFEFHDFKGFGEVKHGVEKLKRGTPEIEIKDLSFKYPNSDKKVFNDITLNIKPGEKIMIVGGDGSGKSTLVKLLCGLYQITDGDYKVDGKSIKDLQRGQLKRKISVLFQDFINYNLTLKENIILGKEALSFDSELYSKAKKITGVDKLMKTFKISDNQILGKYLSKGMDVSPGFWQRIALSRILYRNKDVIILDEPFTYIDDGEEKTIISELFEFFKEKTVIYISREARNRKMFDNVYSLSEGKLQKY